MNTTSTEPHILARIFGANWSTTVSAWGGSIMAALTFISGLSYDIGPLSLIIKPEWKGTITTIAGCATVILWFWNGVQQKSKNVTGGSVQQTISGNVADKGTQTLVDQTLVASAKSGEDVTSDQQHVLDGLPKAK